MQPDQKPSSYHSWRHFSAVQFGNPGNSHSSGGFLVSRRSAPYPNPRIHSALCYFCGSSEHLLRSCTAFQEAKTANMQSKRSLKCCKTTRYWAIIKFCLACFVFPFLIVVIVG